MESGTENTTMTNIKVRSKYFEVAMLRRVVKTMNVKNEKHRNETLISRCAQIMHISSRRVQTYQL
jgi:hypothetical protein